MSEQKRVYWFWLVTAFREKGFKVIVDDKVLLSSAGVDVGDFRDAVKLKNPVKLVDADPSDLKVFENQAAFEAKNRQPLKVSSSVCEMGVSCEDPMFVVFPSSHIDLSLADMFSKHAAGIVDIGIELLPFVSQVKKVFVRHSYVELFRMICKEDDEGNLFHTKVLITGTPGIGKTMFLIYCASTLVVEHKKTVFLHLISAASKFIISPTGVEKFETYINKFPEGADWYYLADSVEPLNTPCALTILTVSPRLNFANEFEKNAITYYMPLWDWTELEVCHRTLKLDRSLIDIAARFEILDGVPRWLFSTVSTAEKMVVDAIDSTPPDDLLLSPKLGRDKALAHILVLHIASQDYTSYYPRYASRFVAEKVYLRLKEHGKLRMQHFVMSSDQYSHVGGLRGQLYEYLAHKSLSNGSKYKKRALYKDPARKSNEVFVTIPCASRVIDKFSKLAGVYGTTRPNANDKTYYLPKYGFEAVDSWMQNEGMFQITVGKTHDLKPMIHEVSAKCNSKKLYFVVPDQDTFKKFKYVVPDAPGDGVKAVQIEEFVLLLQPVETSTWLQSFSLKNVRDTWQSFRQNRKRRRQDVMQPVGEEEVEEQF